MKKLLFLLLACCSFVFCFGETKATNDIPYGTAIGIYKESSGSYQILYNQSTPYKINKGGTLTLNINKLQGYQKFEWKLRSGAPAGTSIKEISADGRSITISVGNSYGWVVLDLTATGTNGTS